MSSDEIDGPPPPERDTPSEEAPEEASADASEGAPEADLGETLLHQSIAGDDQPWRRWAYPLWLRMLVSIFILYHGVILLVHNLPSKGLARGIQKKINQELKVWPPSEATFGLDANRYWRASGNTQSWAMFAPNPHRSNIFMKVLVKDMEGEIWDLKHDIYGKRSYPYLWYDRMGKINRRIVDQKGYRRHYAAWVCREWEKNHEGQPADEVQFVKMWTKIPSPQAVYKRAQGNIFEMGYDPMDLHLYQREEDAIRCKTTRHAQLPNFLRERYGLPTMPDKHFLDLHNRTWWDKQESERKKEEREAKRESKKVERKKRLKRAAQPGGAP